MKIRMADDGYIVAELHTQNVQRFMKQSAPGIKEHLKTAQTTEEKSNMLAAWVLCAIQDWNCLGKHAKNTDIPCRSDFSLCKVDKKMWGVQHEEGVVLPSGFGWFELGYSMEWPAILNACFEEAGIVGMHVWAGEDGTIGVYADD
jgi:hypothetical protein